MNQCQQVFHIYLKSLTLCGFFYHFYLIVIWLREKRIFWILRLNVDRVKNRKAALGTYSSIATL